MLLTRRNRQKYFHQCAKYATPDWNWVKMTSSHDYILTNLPKLVGSQLIQEVWNPSIALAYTHTPVWQLFNHLLLSTNDIIFDWSAVQWLVEISFEGLVIPANTCTPVLRKDSKWRNLKSVKLFLLETSQPQSLSVADQTWNIMLADHYAHCLQLLEDATFLKWFLWSFAHLLL